MDFLPVELLVDIFGFLSFSDLQTCCQVCKRWHEILHDDATLPLSKSLIVLDYNAINDPDKVDKFFDNFLSTILDRGSHLAVERLTLVGWSVRDIWSRWNDNWQRFFSNLKYLDITSTDSSMLMWLSTIIKFCSDSLTSLRFIDIRYNDFNLSDIDFTFQTFANALSNVRHFEFTTSEELTGETIHKLVALMQNLDSVSFRDRSGESTILQLFVSLRQLRTDQLQTLVLDWTNLADDELASLATIPEFRLRELSLEGCYNLTSRGVMDYCFEKGSYLQTLNLNSCKNIVWSDHNQVNTFKTLSCISTLKMGGLTMRGEFNFSDAITHLGQLRILEISDLSINDELLANALSHQPLLRRLVMQETMSDQKQLIRIVNFQTSLTHLDLSRSKAVTNQSLQSIISKSCGIQSLRLSGCLLVSDNGFTGQNKWGSRSTSEKTGNQKIDSLVSLREVSLGGIMLTDTCISSCFHFTNLNKINVSICRYLTDDGLVKIAKFNQKLQIFEARWSLLSDKGLLQILNLLPRLTVLDIEGCDQISKNSIQQIPGKCKYLKKLVLSGCNIDSLEIQSIFNNGRPTLRVNFNPLYTPVVKAIRIN